MSTFEFALPPDDLVERLRSCVWCDWGAGWLGCGVASISGCPADRAPAVDATHGVTHHFRRRRSYPQQGGQLGIYGPSQARGTFSPSISPSQASCSVPICEG